MLFNGGFVPTYLIYSQIFHITDTIWALIVPYLLMNAFFVIMVRTYINSNVPNEVIEAATIDGSGEFNTLIKVVVPMSKPIIGTIASDDSYRILEQLDKRCLFHSCQKENCMESRTT